MTPALRGLFALLAGSLLGIAMYTRPQALSVALLVPVIILAAAAALGGDFRLSISVDRLYSIVIRSVIALGLLHVAVSLRASAEIGSAAEWAGWTLLIVVIGGSAFGTLDDRIGARASVVFFLFYSLAIAWAIAPTFRGGPLIDVMRFQQGAAAALYDGVNPYAMRFPDLYGAKSVIFYGEGVSVDGILNFGFPYLPLSLMLIIPFDWVLSDFRIAHAVAIVGAGILMSLITRDARSRGAAVAFLLIAPVFYVLKFGWTEPLLVLGAIGVIYIAARGHRGTSFLTGVLVSIKQYGILFLPSSLLLLERPWKSKQIAVHLAKAGTVVVVTTLPFFLWNPEAFMRSVVELQFLQPFRADSLAFPAVFADYFGEPNRIVVGILPLVLVGIVAVVTLARTPTGAQGFALASGLTLLTAFAFSKQAFDNYYILVMALLFGAAAASGRMATRNDAEDRADSVAATHDVPADAAGH